MLTLSDTGLYKQLLMRKTSNAIKYSGILIPIASDVDFLLQYIKIIFPSYPDHGIQHSFRILNYLSFIIDDSTQNAMSDTELFSLIMAALFHDTGMSLFNHEDLKNLREKHHDFSSIVLDKYFKENLTIISQRERLRPLINFICYAHGISLQELYDDPRFSKKDRIEFDEVRYSLLSILLRLGDLMDLEECRANEFVLSHFRSTYSFEAINHNIRHTLVQTYNYGSEELSIEVLVENAEQYKIWSTWFDYLTNDILYANTYLQKYSIHFPMPTTKINKAMNAVFDVEELRFEIDDKGGIWNILSQSIYTNEYDFVRELVQNSIDATLVKIYLDTNISIDSISPRSWNASNHCSHILLGYSEKRKMLFVIDAGIGMNKQDLKKFLFKVTGSGYTEFDVRKFIFPSIAKFGIGFVSCLINANNIEILTKKQEETTMLNVSLASDSNLAFIQDVSVDGYPGTVIKLNLKYDFTYTSIASYLKDTFIYPSMGIICLDIDSLEKISNLVIPSIDFNMILNTTYSFRKHYDHVLDLSREFTAPITQKILYLDNLMNETSNLIDWLNDNKHIDEDFSDKAKFKLFQEKVRVLNSIAKKDNDGIPNFPLNERIVNEKGLFNSPDRYINILEKFSSEIRKKADEFRSKRTVYDVNQIIIECSPISMGFDWKYCIVFFNGDLQIHDIKYVNDPIDLSMETGVIFANYENTNFNDGIEFAAINGFLFSKGKICTTVAKFTGYLSSHSQSTEETFTIGSFRNDFNLDDDLEQYFSDDFYNLESSSEYPYQLDGDSVGYGREIKSIFDAIQIKDNHFLYLQGIDFSRINSTHPSQKSNIVNDIYSEGVDVFDNVAEAFFQQYDFGKKTIDIDRIVHGDFFVFCQDGIQLPLNLRGLFPIGMFKISCNCTAGSRMALNVTRHKISENRSDIDNWMNTYGLNLQKSLINNIFSMVKSFSLDLDIDELLDEVRFSDYFSRIAAVQFRYLCQEES